MNYFRNTTSGSAEVLEENNYYPFGLRHNINILSASNSSYNYQYNGKELQTETGWNDYGARMYMSDIGRWCVIDPLAEQMRRYSPYNYSLNNPVNFVDPDGRKSMIYNDGGIMRWEFDPLTTLSGSSWFEDSIMRNHNYSRAGFLANGLSGGGGGGFTVTGDPAGSIFDYLMAGGSINDISVNNDMLSWWTDADGAQYGQYNMLKLNNNSWWDNIKDHFVLKGELSGSIGVQVGAKLGRPFASKCRSRYILY